MDATFYIAGAVAVLATILMVASSKPVHALLNLVVSLLAVAVVFYTMGAPFAAALEAIVYAGAIMVLFVFMVMLLNLREEPPAIQLAGWVGPVILAAILIAELFYILIRGPAPLLAGGPVEPKQVGIALFGPYVIGVELASVLLLAGLVGAFHLGGRRIAQITNSKDEPHVVHTDERRADSGSNLVLAGTDRPSRTS